MSTFSIQIDATQLIYRSFIIPSQTADFISSSIVQSLDLEPGAYNFQVGSGFFADFTFRVTSEGTIDFDDAFGSFLDGRGTSTLIIKGLQVTLDARYLSGSGVLLASMPDQEFFSYKQCRMVPASFYSVQQGSGEVTNFTFQLRLDGTFWYNSSYDISSGGFLAGNGTSTLEFLGYPILVDARAAQGQGLTIVPIVGMPFTPTAVQFADLLPAESFALQVNPGIVTQAMFKLDTGGMFSFNSSLSPFLELDTFNGLTRLKVKGPLP